MGASMGLFSWLFGQREDQSTHKDNWDVPPKRSAQATTQSGFRINGSGHFDFDVVGEASYQGALLSIAGPKSANGAEKYCDANLVPEDNNRYDKNAVAVKISGKTVGYLSRSDARYWRKRLSIQGRSGQTATARAVIVGGWKRRGDEGSFGVRLDID